MNELAGVTGSVVQQALLREIGGNADEKPISIDGCHGPKSSGPQMAGSFPCWFQHEPECAPASAADI